MSMKTIIIFNQVQIKLLLINMYKIHKTIFIMQNRILTQYKITEREIKLCFIKIFAQMTIYSKSFWRIFLYRQSALERLLWQWVSCVFENRNTHLKFWLHDYSTNYQQLKIHSKMWHLGQPVAEMLRFVDYYNYWLV